MGDLFAALPDVYETFGQFYRIGLLSDDAIVLVRLWAVLWIVDNLPSKN